MGPTRQVEQQFKVDLVVKPAVKMHHSFLFFLQNLVHSSPMQQTPEESGGSEDVTWGPLGHSTDEAQPKSAAKPVPVPLKTGRYHLSSALIAQTLARLGCAEGTLKVEDISWVDSTQTTWGFEDRRSKTIYQVRYQPVLASLPPLPLAQSCRSSGPLM